MRFPLLFGSALGVAFGSAALAVDVSEDLDSDELLSDLLSVFDSDDLESDGLDSAEFDSDLLSDLDSVEFFESDAADFLYDSLR